MGCIVMGDLFNSNEFIAFRQGIRLAVRSRSGGLASGVKDQCLQAKIDEINKAKLDDGLNGGFRIAIAVIGILVE